MKRRAGARAVARGGRPEPPRAKSCAPSRPKRVASGILSLRKALLSLSGLAKGLPRDFADNHDHYIHGTPKK
ncbi:MAG: hypothetical protein HYY18_21540 [Planctomycetes bacterium]|nr:hypothetical protein [Planctomycetota bacterium]